MQDNPSNNREGGVIHANPVMAVMAYAQWSEINIKPKEVNVVIKNINLHWGKFYSGSKDNEVSAGSLEGKKVLSGEIYTIGTCGRSGAASGTEGEFDIHDASTNKKIGHYYWSCPWGDKQNTSSWSDGEQGYEVHVTGANTDSGALGSVNIEIIG
jgi:hypothetical protein